MNAMPTEAENKLRESIIDHVIRKDLGQTLRAIREAFGYLGNMDVATPEMKRIAAKIYKAARKDK